MEKILEDFSRSRVILFGDYHTLNQSQRSFVRLLRAYFESRKDRKITVALEAVQARFQKSLQQFFLGKIKQQEFIKRIGFKRHWFFDLWPNYEIIFDFLIYHHIPLLGIDADSRKNFTLAQRDDFMARHIVDLLKKYPGEKIVVLTGDLHLAPGHLPAKIKMFARRKKIKAPILTLYQNSPAIYWRLSDKEHLDHVPFVKIRDGEYCRMHTPPVIAQQSYLNWLYHEGGEFDWADAKGSFLSIVRRIAGILDMKLMEDYESVEVYTCGDLSFLQRLRRKKIYTRTEMRVIEEEIVRSNSYFLPKARLVYLANVSLHHAAQEASQYIKYLFSGEALARGAKDAFYAKIIAEAVGFFGSKLINAQRKCPRATDYRSEIRFLEKSGQAKSRHLEFETANLFLQHDRLVKKGEIFHGSKIANLTGGLFLELARAIGDDFGDQLYYGFMDGLVDKVRMRTLYEENFEEGGEPGKVYLHYLKLLKDLKRPVQL